MSRSRELVRRGEIGEPELSSDIGGEAETAREDREREPRDDLVRAQRDHEERMDRGHRRAGQARRENGEDEHRCARSLDALRHPETDHRAEQHHPLDAEVEDTGALGQELAERRKEQRRAVQDRLRRGR